MTTLSINPASHDLETAISVYRASLQDGELFEYDLASLDRLGVPIKIASLFLDGEFTNDGFGYGATALEASVGALGEMAETFHTTRALRTTAGYDGYSTRRMRQEHGDDLVIDPRTLCLPAGLDYTDDSPLRWVEVRHWPSLASHWAPRECIALDGSSYDQSNSAARTSGVAAQRLFPPITCGLGAGLTTEQALAHGVLELLQRDGNCTTFRAMDRGLDIELDTLADPGIGALIDELAGHGLRVRPKLASTEFGLTNLYVIADNLTGEEEPFPLMATACGEAVHANREVALRKALLEYISSRSRKAFMHGSLDRIRALTSQTYHESVMAQAEPAKEEPRAVQGMAHWLTLSEHELRVLLRENVFSSREKILFSDLPSVSLAAVKSPVDRLADVTRRLAAENLSIFFFDASPALADGPKVIKALVPGLEGETMSYYRLGARGVQRLLERNVRFVAVGAQPASSKRIVLTPAAESSLGGAAFLLTGEVDRIVGSCYSLYREPSSHAAQKLLAGSKRTAPKSWGPQ